MILQNIDMFRVLLNVLYKMIWNCHMRTCRNDIR